MLAFRPLLLLILVATFAAFEATAQEESTSSDSLWQRALSLYNQGELTSAVSCLDQLLSLDPNHKEALSYRGHICRELGRFEDDFNSWDRYVSLDSTNAFGWFNRAFPLWMLKRYGEAADSYRRASRLAPNDSLIMMGYGRFLMETGDYEGAKEQFERAASTPPTDRAASAFALACETLLKQLTGVGVPPLDWRPDYDRYLSNFGVSQKEYFLIQHVAGPGGGARAHFEGSADNPFIYVPGFSVWGGGVINDPEYGILLENGTQLSYIMLSGHKSSLITGKIENWKVKVVSEKAM